MIYICKIKLLSMHIIPLIYSLRIMEESWLPPSYTSVGETQIDYSWQGICFVGNGVEGVGTGSGLQNCSVV